LKNNQTSDHKKTDQSSRIPPNAPKVIIRPWTKAWNAWLKHHAGTKTETRMLLSLAPNAGPWREATEFPPLLSAANVTRREPEAPTRLPAKDAAVTATYDEVAVRLERRSNLTESRERELVMRLKLERTESDILARAMSAVQNGHRPEVKDVENFGSVDVADPMSLIRECKVTALRDDPLGRMFKRKLVTEAQFVAGRRLQALYEAVEIGSIRAFDPTRSKVDGGGKAEIHIPEPRLVRMLAEIELLLGNRGAEYARAFLLHRTTATQLAERAGKPNNKQEAMFFADRLRGILDEVVSYLGINEATGTGSNIRSFRLHPFGVNAELWEKPE
jgi:hypothetical protein